MGGKGQVATKIINFSFSHSSPFSAFKLKILFTFTLVRSFLISEGNKLIQRQCKVVGRSCIVFFWVASSTLTLAEHQMGFQTFPKLERSSQKLNT